MFPDLIPGVTATENILSQLLDESDLDLDLVLSAGDEYTDAKPLLDPPPVQEISKDELKYEPPTLEQPVTTSNLELQKAILSENLFSQITDLEKKLNSIEKRLHEYTGEVELLEDCTGIIIIIIIIIIFCCSLKFFAFVNPFHAMSLFLDPLKTPENLRFSDVFRQYRKIHGMAGDTKWVNSFGVRF